MNNNPPFDELWYTENFPDVAQSGIAPFDHYLQVGIHLGRRPGEHFSADLHRGPFLSDRSFPNRDECLFGYIDFPPEGDFVGHDYIRVIGWCYNRGERIKSVTGQIVGSKRITPLRFAILRPDVGNVFRQLKFTNVGFQGDIYPYVGKSDKIQLLITVVTVRGDIHEMTRNLKLDPTVKAAPANIWFATSEVSQHVNDSNIFSDL